MALATPITNKFHIGSAELRIGPMTSAMKLTQSHSVGLLQSVTVNYNQESVDLEAGLPKTLVDTVITRTNVTISAQAYEYARKNIRVMINEGIDSTADGATDFAQLVTSSITTSGTPTTVLNVSDTSGFSTANPWVTLYNVNKPEEVSVCKIASVQANTSITLAAGFLPMFNANANECVVVSNRPIGLGKTTKTQYFAVQLVGMEHSTGRPIGFHFWKCAVSGGMEFSFNNDNWAITPLTFKVLMPSSNDYATDQPLDHLADTIPTHPFGMYIGSQKDAAGSYVPA